MNIKMKSLIFLLCGTMICCGKPITVPSETCELHSIKYIPDLPKYQMDRLAEMDMKLNCSGQFEIQSINENENGTEYNFICPDQCK